MKIYLAQSGGKWLQRVDGNSQMTSEAFAAHVAAQFGLDPATVSVSTRVIADGEDITFRAALAAGTFESLAVTAAPVPAAVPPQQDYEVQYFVRELNVLREALAMPRLTLDAARSDVEDIRRQAQKNAPR